MPAVVEKIKTAESPVPQAPIARFDPFVAPPPPVPSAPLDTTKPPPTPERFAQVHIPEWGAWLLWKLQRQYTRLNGRNYLSMLGNYMFSNTAFFRKTRHACLLAVVEHEPLDPQPVIREVFMFVTDKEFNEEALDLYRELLIWARGLQAKRVERVGNFSDLAPQTIQALMKKAGWEPHSAAEIVSAVT